MRLGILIVAVAGLVAGAARPVVGQEVERGGERAAKAEALVRVFDVRDLAPDGKGLADLVVGVEAAVGPGEEATVAAHGTGTIVVRATPKALARVTAFLDARRKGVEKKIVLVNMRVVVTAKSVLPFGDERGAQVLFSRDRIPKLLAAIRSASEAEIKIAPRIACLDGQRANLSVTSQVAYVKDFEITVTASGDTVADPIVGTITEGLTVDATPTLAEGGIRLDLAATIALLQRPIAEFSTKIDGSTVPVTIQLPELGVTKAAAAGILVPTGKALYFSLGRVKRSDGKGTELYGLIVEVEAAGGTK